MLKQLSSNLRPTYQLMYPAFPTSRQEVPRFLEQSAVPVVAFLGATFLVAVLSRQFLRVGTAWQKRQKERKAAKVRKIQCLGLSKWPPTVRWWKFDNDNKVMLSWFQIHMNLKNKIHFSEFGFDTHTHTLDNTPEAWSLLVIYCHFFFCISVRFFCFMIFFLVMRLSLTWLSGQLALSSLLEICRSALKIWPKADWPRRVWPRGGG